MDPVGADLPVLVLVENYGYPSVTTYTMDVVLHTESCTGSQPDASVQPDTNTGAPDTSGGTDTNSGGTDAGSNGGTDAGDGGGDTGGCMGCAGFQASGTGLVGFGLLGLAAILWRRRNR